MGQAKRDFVEKKNNRDSFTVAELLGGVCPDTIAAMRVGLKPIWSREINKGQDLKTEQLCTDWARPGQGLGSQRDTGWMSVKQTEIILLIESYDQEESALRSPVTDLHDQEDRAQ